MVSTPHRLAYQTPGETPPPSNERKDAPNEKRLNEVKEGTELLQAQTKFLLEQTKALGMVAIGEKSPNARIKAKALDTKKQLLAVSLVDPNDKALSKERVVLKQVEIKKILDSHYEAEASIRYIESQQKKFLDLWKTELEASHNEFRGNPGLDQMLLDQLEARKNSAYEKISELINAKAEELFANLDFKETMPTGIFDRLQPQCEDYYTQYRSAAQGMIHEYLSQPENLDRALMYIKNRTKTIIDRLQRYSENRSSKKSVANQYMELAQVYIYPNQQQALKALKDLGPEAKAEDILPILYDFDRQLLAAAPFLEAYARDYDPDSNKKLVKRFEPYKKAYENRRRRGTV